MAFLCQNFLRLPAARHAVLCGGSTGLTRAISWFHALESVEETKFLQPDELVFFTGISVGEDEKQLLALFDGLVHEHAAGLVVNVGKYVRHIPASLIRAADQKDMPLFELPWEVRLGDVTQELGRKILSESAQERNLSGLLKKCLFSDEEKLEHYDLSLFDDAGLSGEKQILLMEIPGMPSAEEKQREHIVRVLDRAFRTERIADASLWNGGELILLLSGNGVARDRLQSLRTRLQKETGWDSFFGLGSVCRDVVDLRKSLQEARFALRLAHDPARAHIAFYAKSGAFRLLHCVKRDVLQSFAEEVLGSLFAYDAQNHANMAQTLEVYLNQNEDTAATLARLYIHRNTLSYRLHRIEEITGKSMDDAEARLDFRLAFKIRTYLSLG